MNRPRSHLHSGRPGPFSSALVDRIRASGNVWRLAGGEILLPRVFGFCYGVRRALAMLEQALPSPRGRQARRLVLLGEIIHNPWVNGYFQSRGVRLLDERHRRSLAEHVSADDTAVIPAFGVPPAVERDLRGIGCRVIDTSCGDVRRLWIWALHEAGQGFGIVIFGRAAHDETVVTTSRLHEAGGRYLVLGDIEQVHLFARLLARKAGAEAFRRAFDPQTTNARSIRPFLRLAQVSQTTMLYSQTLTVREVLQRAFASRFGRGARRRLAFQPTVCRATQDRQSAAVELCESGLDLAVVVGGFGSSNTRHLFDLARRYGPAVFIEDASAIISPSRLNTMDLRTLRPLVMRNWLPRRRPLRIGVLAGASTPEIVVGDVLGKLGKQLGVRRHH